jgi:hypothetical protein
MNDKGLGHGEAEPTEKIEGTANSSTSPGRIRYQDGVEPTILSSTTTERGNVFNRIKAGSRGGSRIVMRQGN